MWAPVVVLDLPLAQLRELGERLPGLVAQRLALAELFAIMNKRSVFRS
jgi:hypothetical protein